MNHIKSINHFESISKISPNNIIDYKARLSCILISDILPDKYQKHTNKFSVTGLLLLIIIISFRNQMLKSTDVQAINY